MFKEIVYHFIRMYTPSQKGGAYITSTVDPLTIATPDITLATLSTYGDLASLSLSQISELIDTVTGQIARESATIVTAQTQMTSIQATIDALPGGLQDAYDKANAEYISVLNAYNSAQRLLGVDQSTLSTKMGQLADLSRLSSIYESSLRGYEIEYSTVWNTIQTNNGIMGLEEAAYQDRLRNYTDYQTRYRTAIERLQSTIDALKYNSSILSTATYAYYSTSTTYGHLLEDYIYFSTHNLSTSQYEFTSTNKYLSSLLDFQSTQLGIYISTSTAYHLANLNVASAEAALNYSKSLTAEQEAIIRYNDLENQIDALINGISQAGGGQEGGARDISYYATFPPPPGQELAYQTIFLMLSTMSTAMFSTSRVRAQRETANNTIFQNNLKEILDFADDNIATARRAYDSAQRHRGGVISTMSGLSTRISLADIDEGHYFSTLSTLSSIYLQDISTYNGINASISTYIYNQDNLSSLLRSTLLTLSMLAAQSTMYNISVGIYSQSYIGYSTIEGITQSSINGYSTIKGNMISTIAGLDGEIGSLNATTSSKFSDLTAQATTFYTNVTTDLNNQLDAYKYGVQEWNSFIGYICSELLIHKLTLYTAIETVTFALQDNITQEQRTTFAAEKAGYTSKQTAIQGIIDVLNNLDLQFSSLLELVETERGNKAAFVNTRSILTRHEIAVLRDETQKSVLQGQYIHEMSALNSRVFSINNNILQRNQKMSAINAIINPQLSIIGGLNLFSYIVPDPLNTALPPFNVDKTQYELLAQLDYSLNPELYPLVLTQPIVTPSQTTSV